MNITQEMIDFYKARTAKHIALVGKYCKMLYQAFPTQYSELLHRAAIHDASKYQEPEYTPYIFITWDYKCKREGVDFVIPQEIKDKMSVASHHHVTSNSHHPEFWSPQVKSILPNRDKAPKEMVDATTMPDIDIAEMVADWCGMSAELGNSPREWANKNVNIKWKFTQHQTDLIYKLIDAVWK